MLIVPSGHWQEAPSGPRRITRRERWILGGVLAVVAVLVVIVAISFTSKQRTSANGCIDVSAATVIGGSELYRCGTAARAKRHRCDRQHLIPARARRRMPQGGSSGTRRPRLGLTPSRK
jgi:hypothetical protein